HGTAHHHRADGSPFPWEECAARDTALHGTIHHVDEELFWRRDGTSFPVEFISTPIREEGELAGVVVVFRDITERKRVERELNQAHQSLLNAEVEKKRFYREVIRAVTQDKLHLVDAGEIPIKGQCILQVDLTDIEGYRSLRKRLRDVALDAGMDPEDAEDLVLGVGEAVINAVKHGREGRAEIYTAPGCIIARVSDRGEGIRAEQIPATILLPGYSTQISLGMGFTIMLQVMDRVWLATGPEGTTIQLERSLLAQERDRRIPPPAWHKL
ncbi:MAG TPA: ATP-binding protein, partial [Armatimonadota bacterium]|nr:ATP-binding protein [Armatimonadota bacterium]